MSAKHNQTPVTKLAEIEVALHDLKNARAALRRAGCKKAADYVARAMKSAEGAERNAWRLARPFFVEAADRVRSRNARNFGRP